MNGAAFNMKSLMRTFIAVTLVFFSFNVNASTQTLTQEEAVTFTKQFIDEGKSLALQHKDLTKEPDPALKKKFYDFLIPKIASQTARSILGRVILTDLKKNGLTAESYLSEFVSKLAGYEVKFYGSPEKIKIFQQATYDEKTAKVDLSPDGTQARVQITFAYDGKTANIQFFIIKENGVLKLDDLGVEGVSQKSFQGSEIKSFYAAPDKGNNNPTTFMTWFKGIVDTYLAQ